MDTCEYSAGQRTTKRTRPQQVTGDRTAIVKHFKVHQVCSTSKYRYRQYRHCFRRSNTIGKATIPDFTSPFDRRNLTFSMISNDTSNFSDIDDRTQSKFTSSPTPTRNIQRRSQNYLLWLSNEHVNFMKPELESLFKLFNIKKSILDAAVWYGPMVILSFDGEEDVHKILSRSVLIRSCYEVWASGSSFEELHSNFKSNLNPAHLYEHSSFRLRVESFGKKFTQTEKLEIIDTMDYIPLKGPVNLTSPECSLHLIQYHDSDPVTSHPLALPRVVFLGRWIGDGQRKIVTKISLQQRKFIGNTSMDPLLSLIMANLALVRGNSIVYDPFVGSGSILVAAAIMGGYVMGCDIDYLMLHAKSKPTKAKVRKRAADESLKANFRQYGVESQFLDVFVADASLPLLKTALQFDTIITDPPYGVRESIERIGSEKVDCKVPEEHLDNHYPQKVMYTLFDIFKDLLDFSAKRLHLGGRLVSWIPVARQHYDQDHLPHNQCLKLVSNSEQVLSSYYGRRLLVYEKISEPDETIKTIMNSDSPMYKFRLLEKSSDDKTSKTTECEFQRIQQ